MKSFLANHSKSGNQMPRGSLVSGPIRVVIVRFDDGGPPRPICDWAPYFCTDPSAEVQDILEAVAPAGQSKNIFTT